MKSHCTTSKGLVGRSHDLASALNAALAFLGNMFHMLSHSLLCRRSVAPVEFVANFSSETAHTYVSPS